MGICVQCYPCLIKNDLPNQQSSVRINPIVNDIEENEQNNNNKKLKDNNLKNNEKKKGNNLDKNLNYGPTLEKNEHDENINENVNNEFNNSPKNNNILRDSKRRRSLLSEHKNHLNYKYNKLQSFNRQLSTESFLRAKTKGDKIIENIPKHLGPKQISWGEGIGVYARINNMFGRNNGEISISSKYNHYLKRITEQAEDKTVKRLSVIKEDETEEDKGNSTVIMKKINLK